MDKLYFKSEDRGYAKHSWLETYHSFSFADYYDPKKISFGVLRVINDDIIAPGMGFGNHPHENMEIITIPLEGELKHEDNMGNSSVIKTGDVQVMSAGKGIFHSEYNNNKDSYVKLFQIWLFPDKKNVDPRYDQISFDLKKQENNFQQILSPYKDDEGVWIHQNAWFFMGDFDPNQQIEYNKQNEENYVYLLLVDGEIEIDSQKMGRRDALGILDSDKFKINILSKKSKILLMEIPKT